MDGHACRLQDDRVVRVLVKNGPVFLHGVKVQGKNDATCQMRLSSLNGRNKWLSCKFMSTKVYLFGVNLNLIR